MFATPARSTIPARPSRDPARRRRPLVDEARVHLHEVCAGAHEGHGVGRALDAAHPDHDHLASEASADATDHLERAGTEGRTAETSRADGAHAGRGRDEAGPRDRGVGGDDPLEAHLFDHREHVLDLRVVEVGGDLDEQTPCLALPGLESRQERPRVLPALHRAEARRVGRRDVDDDEVGHAGDRVERGQIVLDDALDVVGRHRPGLADRHPGGHRQAGAHRPETRGGAHRTLVGEAEPVDERAIGGQTEHVRVGVRRLRLGRHRPELEVPEAERREGPRAAHVLVEPSGEAQRRPELEAHHRDADAVVGPRREHLLDPSAQPREVLDRREARERQRMRDVWRKEKEERAKTASVHVRGRRPAGLAARPRP